mgnify:CR=1 FL=1
MRVAGGNTPAFTMTDKDEPTFQQVADMMAMMHKQNMEVLDRIIELKKIPVNEVTNDDEVSD